MTFLFTEISAVNAKWNLYPFNSNFTSVLFSLLNFSDFSFNIDVGKKLGHFLVDDFTCFSSSFSSGLQGR